MMAGPRIASLFTGTGALDLAVMDVFGGEMVWHSQYEPPNTEGREDTVQYAARILARHWPGVPNLGDITAVDWRRVLDEHGPVDILTGGFPCTDVSSAGQRAGLTPETRSGLWAHMARATHFLRPRLVVIENVQGLLSARAASDVEPCPHCVGDESVEPPLRALGAVLGDLAGLGFDAEWARVAASEVGAPHPRQRVFVLAWPVDADAQGVGRREGRPEPARVVGGSHVAQRGGPAVADTDRDGLQGQRSDAGADSRRSSTPAVGCGPAGSDLATADADRLRWRAEVLQLRPGQPDLDWGAYGPAIRRWEHVLGRPAPWPTDLRGRLTPVFSEWMMGLPDGWVTCTPGPEGMSPAALRNAMLKALGNGVVRMQAAVAVRLLHERAGFPAVRSVVEDAVAA